MIFEQLLFVLVTKPKQWFRLYDMKSQTKRSNYSVSQVQVDLTGMIATLEKKYRLYACPMNFDDFGHVTTICIFTHIKTTLISSKESSSMIN